MVDKMAQTTGKDGARTFADTVKYYAESSDERLKNLMEASKRGEKGAAEELHAYISDDQLGGGG